jgi:hypothetical protein
MKRILTLIALLPLISVAYADGDAKDSEKEVPEAKTYVTEHSARVGGKNIEYTVTAGTMLMENESAPTAAPPCVLSPSSTMPESSNASSGT